MSLSTPSDNRKIPAGLVFLSGLVAGVTCYLIAEAMTPKQVTSPGRHDILLVTRLGFIYTPFVGLWLGWMQKSWRRALLGALVGVVIGCVYMCVFASRNFLAIMVDYPCLLGGGLAAVVGSNRSDWLTGLGARLGKGLLAGVVLSFVYEATFTIAGSTVMTAHDYYPQSYITMMWRARPVAFGIASALFFVLMSWAVGLTRGRWLGSRETETPASSALENGISTKKANLHIPGKSFYVLIVAFGIVVGFAISACRRNGRNAEVQQILAGSNSIAAVPGAWSQEKLKQYREQQAPIIWHFRFVTRLWMNAAWLLIGFEGLLFYYVVDYCQRQRSSIATAS